MMHERFHAVMRLGKNHPVAAVSYIGRDRIASDRSIPKHRASSLPMVGRWRVRDYAPLIEELCGPMGRTRLSSPTPDDLYEGD
ncbi:hypothetical protein [Sphingomonas sp. 1P08PE]|uniref:hypothetical protein n=1 Tax=Sphingomonas sp. 1P08PE TaxID=554122 RepID=UPI0039A08954